MGGGKKNLKKGATAVFLDESGFSLTPHVVRTWAPKDVVPVLIHSGNSKRKISAISGIATRFKRKSFQSNMYFRLHPNKTIRENEIIDFLRQLLQRIRGKIIVIWDNLRAHYSNKVKTFVERQTRIQTIQLPPYCPELNPDEGVWNWSKTKELSNVCVDEIDEMVSRTRGALKKMQRRKNLLSWCLKESELPWDMSID